MAWQEEPLTPGAVPPPIEEATPTPSTPLPPPKMSESDDVLQDGADRELRKHVFIFPALFDSAMVTTNLSVHARVISYSAEDVPTDFGPFSLTATSVAGVLDGGVKILDWLGIYGVLGGRALTGTSLPSLIYVGATFSYGGSLGVNVRIYRNERTGTQLGVRAGASLAKGQIASIIPLFTSAMSQVTLDDALKTPLGDAIRTPVQNVSYGGSFNLAQTISPMFGVQASAGLGGSSMTVEPFDVPRNVRLEQTQTALTYHFGAAVSASFVQFHVPLAVMGEYLLSREYSPDVQRSAGLDSVHHLGLGVYYAGRRNLDLGVFGAAHVGLGPYESRNGSSGSAHAFTEEFVLRYVW